MAAHQAPPSLGFSRQEHWSGLPFPSPTLTTDNCKIRTVLSAKGWVETNLGYCYLYLDIEGLPNCSCVHYLYPALHPKIHCEVLSSHSYLVLAQMKSFNYAMTHGNGQVLMQDSYLGDSSSSVQSLSCV